MELATHSPMVVDEKRAARRPAKAAYARSRLTNGRDLLPDVDGRSLIARRYRDIAAAILVDQGGADRCSESRKQLIRRFAAVAVLAEGLKSKIAKGEPVDIAEHASLSSTAVRLATRIGLDRVARDTTSLAQYLSSRAVEPPDVPTVHGGSKGPAEEAHTGDDPAGAAGPSGETVPCPEISEEEVATETTDAPDTPEAA